MSLKRLFLPLLLVFPTSALAQDDWEHRATFYAWFPGLSSTVETPQGELEADVDFDEILESLDIAVFGAFEARKGRWSFVADAMYADLTTEADTPFGQRFSDGEIDTKMALVGAYAAYALVDRDETRFELGGGLRYTDASVDTRLVGVEGTPDALFEVDGSWTDLVISARLIQAFNDKWYGVGYGDIGGFGIEDSSDLTWQAFGGVGYRNTQSWSTLFGYRHLSIEREFDITEVTADISGPFLALQKSF